MPNVTQLEKKIGFSNIVSLKCKIQNFHKMFFVLLKLVTVRQSNLHWLKGYRASPSIWRVRASATDSAALRDIMKGQNNNNGEKSWIFISMIHHWLNQWLFCHIYGAGYKPVCIEWASIISCVCERASVVLTRILFHVPFPSPPDIISMNLVSVCTRGLISCWPHGSVLDSRNCVFALTLLTLLMQVVVEANSWW